MIRYTTGPWHWDCDPIKGDPLNRVRYRVTSKGKTITQCYYSSDDPNTEGDARLIAAAPDLLSALLGMLEDAPSGEAATKARAAIAKALEG